MAASGHYLRSVFCIILACGAFGNRYKHFHRAPIINLNGAEELIGSIREDERTVTLSPQLRVLPETGPICRYDLTSLDGSSKELPFESEVLNKSEGTVQIKLRNGASIDCSKAEWRVQVTALRCADDNARSEPVTLKISVKDTNNHAPQFEAPWYTFEVDEGKVTDIARIFATDADCGHPYGKICRYEITNTLDGNPFEIDDQGVLSTTKPLNHSQADSHILTVVAHDCGMLRSKSTLITVHVRPKCVDGVKTDSKESVRFAPGSGGARLFGPDTDVVMCQREDICTVQNVEAQVDLHLKSITQVDIGIAKECGLQADTLDLLPQTTDPPKETKTSLAEDEDDDELDERIAGDDEQKYLFNGKSNAVIISPNVIKRVIPEAFTLSFVMKHKGDAKDSVKQNLLCETDDFGMNRHHFGVYIRHCKLELLLRREAEGSPAEFRAAEWRWSSPSICDGQWHSYAIIFTDLDNVTLLLDGERFTENERNPEILDDWPLHQTTGHKTKLVVGACWHGRNQAMVQFFNGHLSSMFLLPGAVEPETTIQCLHKHSERLNIHAIDSLIPGEGIIFDKQQTQLTLKAKSLQNLTSLLKEVEFVAGRRNDGSALKVHSVRPGSRSVSVTTRVTCLDNRTIPLGSFQSTVNVIKPDIPHLSISGQNVVSTERRNIKTGVLMLPNIQITVTQNIDGIESDVTPKYSLDWCKVHLKPSRDMDLEYFSSPASLMSALNVDFEHDKQGIMLKGEDSVKNYADVLSKIHYFNSRPEVYNKRLYSVHCSMQGGKVISNEFSVTMTIVDDSIEEAIERLSSLSKKVDSVVVDDDDIMKLEKHFEPSFDQLGANRLQNILEMDLPRPKALLSHHGYEVGGQGAVAGGAVAIVVVICIGFLLVLLVIGVLKLRDHSLPRRRRSRKPTAEGMEWDNDGMNITVNPLENVNKSQQPDMFSEDESVDDEESCHEEDDLTEDDDEDAEVVLPHNGSSQKNGLEWDDEHDDGPLTHSQHSYRV
ncbi:cadherin domain-containing protein [Ditylenchus destructor]|uniref:Cadherin domain-containing protein n=1 Tax=Ditylenchus destructor TaxID=166010 RepID=A0AAD4R9V9_9BILA|nr:cadherin domain-containing protein [Ditylenchus destructor]